MKFAFRRLFMGICLHLLLTGFLLAGMYVYKSSYDHTHAEPLSPAAVHISDDCAEFTLFSRTLTVPLPADQMHSRFADFALTGSPVQFWVCLFHIFTI